MTAGGPGDVDGLPHLAWLEGTLPDGKPCQEEAKQDLLMIIIMMMAMMVMKMLIAIANDDL